MFVRVIGVAIALTSLIGPSAVSASIVPVGDWRIEPSDARCVLARKYGDPKDPTTLAFKAPPMGDALQLVVVRPAYRKTSSQNRATVGIDGKPFETFALGYPSTFPKPSNTSVTLIHLTPDAVAALRGARNMSVSAMSSIDELFPLGDISKAWTDMDACLSRLKQTWNIGAQGNIATDTKPLVPVSGMITQRDFPPQVMAQPWSGTTGFLLLIDEKGSVKDCTLTQSSGMAVVDSRTCAIISYKARFSPALDSSGKPTKSSYSQRITWRVMN